MNRLALSLILIAFPLAAAVAADDGATLLELHCSACHTKDADGTYERIDNIRKSPEGWDMTLVRMMQWHGVALDADIRRALVRHLADTRGLTPEEAAPYRYVLERQPNHIEDGDGDLMEMCARCHSLARVGLQRRDTLEWVRLAHTHVGQYPSIEYSALGRDRNWFELAVGPFAELLGEHYPLDEERWDAWQATERPAVEGRWALAAHRPGVGPLYGEAEVRADGDGYEVSYSMRTAGGTVLEAAGRALVYAGHEWRGELEFGGETWLQVMGLDGDGNRMTGRWFLAEADEVGMDVTAARAGSAPALLSVVPGHLRVGESATVVLHGASLHGVPDLGQGLRVSSVERRGPGTLAVSLHVTDAAEDGAREVHVGGASLPGGFVVYRALDHVRVEPEFAVARVGGGTTEPVTAHFEAVGYLNGPDGEAGTDDDVRVGVLPATWSHGDSGPMAEAMEDARWAGAFASTEDGLFLPAAAGPNPERMYSANNVGDLAVIATVEDGGRTLQGEGRLIVTVQRWNDPPIR